MTDWIDMDANDDPALLAHDFRNQLGIIVGFSDLLLARLPEGDAHRPDVEEIKKAASAALRLLDRMHAAPGSGL
jgi:hypothetical protein